MLEYVKNVIESYRDRLSNPILGAYTISFIICNWRPLLILISSNASIEENINVIDERYSFWEVILWPAMMTGIVVLVVPYLMMGLEYAVLKSSNFRKQLKNSSIIADYAHKINVASMEFEIQNKKSGTRTIEMLQSNIESLETEKQSLINQITQQKEAYQLEINSFEGLLNAEKEKNLSKKNSKLIEFSVSVFDAYNSLEMSGRLEEFISTYDFFGRYHGKTKLINFYIDLGLMKYKDSVYRYTFVAHELCLLNFEMKSPKDYKKKVLSIVDRFNKHEISSIEDIEVDSPFLIIDGFSQPLTLELIENNFIKQLNGRYLLTKKGLELRNIMGMTIFEE